MGKFNPNDYNRTKYKSYLVRVDREKDKAVIERMAKVQNISAYVRGLVYGDMKEVRTDGKETTEI